MTGAAGAAERTAVVVRKHSGIDVVFSIEPSARAAELAIARLAAVGLYARAEPAHPADVPGATKRGKTLRLRREGAR